MDNEFEFFYPIIIEHQMDFEGHDHPKEVLLVGHIVHGGRLLCGESREVIKNRAKATKEKTVKARIEKTKVCQECSDKYKKNGHSAYAAWIEGKPKTPAVKLPKLAKF